VLRDLRDWGSLVCGISSHFKLGPKCAHVFEHHRPGPTLGTARCTRGFKGFLLVGPMVVEHGRLYRQGGARPRFGV